MQPSFMSDMTLDEKQNGCDKSKMGTIGSKMGRKFEQKRKVKWMKKISQVQHPGSVHVPKLFSLRNAVGRTQNSYYRLVAIVLSDSLA